MYLTTEKIFVKGSDKMKIKVSASILGCDLANLESEIKRAELAGADCIHFDVMDGVFVNNISFGLPVLKSAKRVSKLSFDVHLMITDPERYIDRFIDYGADNITFHIEATENPEQCIKICKEKGASVGISVKPATDISVVYPYLDSIDMVLIMTVEPGFGGQGFMASMTDKVKALCKKIKEQGLSTVIQVDGGINEKTARQAVLSGATNLVAGTYLFRSDDIASSVVKLKKSACR